MDSAEFVLDDDAEEVWPVEPQATGRLANGTIAPPLGDEADVLERETRWPELVELLLERSEAAPGTAAQLRLLHRIANIYEHEIGDLESAFTVMQAAFERDARDTLTAREMVRLAEAASQWDERVAALRHLAELEAAPEAKGALYVQLAEAIELHHQDLDGATGAYEEALVHDASSIDALEALTRLYRHMEAWRPLAETLARRTAFAPDDDEQARMWLEVGALWEHHVEDPGEAIRAYRNAVALEPANLGALRALEGLYERSSQHERYVEMLEAELAATQSDAERVTLYQRLAVAAEERLGDFARAARAYEQLLALDPQQHDAYAALAELYERTGDLERLVGTYHDHLAARPDLATQVELCIALGRVYETQLHDIARAIAAYEDAVTIGGDERLALEGLARLYDATGAWNRAVDVLDRLADREPSPDVYCRIGRIHANELGDATSAEASFARALRCAPGHLPAIEALITLHEQRGAWQQAVAMMARAEQYLPLAVDKVRLAFAAGNLYLHELGDDARAKERYATVIALDPEYVEAGRPLAEMYFAAEDWRALSPVIEMLCRKLAPREGELFSRAARCAAELGDVPRALGHYKTAYELDPTHLPTVTGRADLLFRTEDWATAAKLYQTLVTEQHGDEWAIVESYYRLGAIKRALGDRHKALALFEQALERAPHHHDALAASVELRTQLGDWATVVEGKRALLATTDDAGDQIRLHTEIGAIYQDKLHDTRQAAKSYVEALMIAPENHQLLQKLLDLCIDSKQWRKALEVIERFVALEQDPFKRGLYFHAAGTLCRDELAELGEAVDHYNAALDSFFAQPLDEQQLPRALRSFEAIDKVLTTQRDWKAQERAYRAMISRLPKDGRYFQLQVSLLDALAEIYRSRLKQYDAATTAFEVAQQMDPNNKLRAGADRAEILAELHVMAGVDHADKAIDQYARVLRREPFSYDTYHALARIYEATNQYDKRWCVCSALKFLRRATADELEFADQHKAQGFAKARRGMTATSWAKLAHPDENRYISAILGACSRGVAAVKAHSLKDFGLRREDRRELANDPLMFSKLFLHLARVLDVQVPDVYLVEDHKPVDIQLANTSDTPSFVVRPQQLHGKSEREVAFLLTRRLAFMRPEYFLRMLLPTNTELKVVLLSAIVMVQPSFPVPPNMVAPIQQYMPELRRRMPAAALEQLGALVHAFVQATPELDLAKWSHAVDAAAHRASFVMCGELDTAARAIVAEPVVVDGPTSKDKVKQLVLFSVSEDYFAIRSQLELTI